MAMKLVPSSVVLIVTADGRKLLCRQPTAFRRLWASKAGTASHASGRGHRFTSATAAAAARKRWARHPPTGRGYRKGARFVFRPRVARAPLRAYYARHPTLGIQYSPPAQGWFVTDDHGTRQLSERAALIKLGHLPRANDRVVPVAIQRRVK